eukprot:SAG31_NODE_7621_length_1637_cov_1.854356_2_plen_69_part_00
MVYGLCVWLSSVSCVFSYLLFLKKVCATKKIILILNLELLSSQEAYSYVSALFFLDDVPIMDDNFEYP